MNYMELNGNNIGEDVETIKAAIDKNNGVVFVYSGKDTLYDYINALSGKGQGLDAEYLYKFKICYENKHLQLSYSRDNGHHREVSSMSSLIHELDGEQPCRLVVENDDRVQLAFIVQQLIYIEYPLEKVDILLKKEERDASRTKRFMEKVEELRKNCHSADLRLRELRETVATDPDEESRGKCLEDIDAVLDSCADMKEQIDKALDVELKFAVAASKKAGKSVIVNCFLGEQVAPTSTELATPNNCFYKKSRDKNYHLQLEGEGTVRSFESRKEIYEVIDGYFRDAQNNKEEGFALPNMNIEYVTEDNNFSSYTIFDTAGPDAAGTGHGKVAEDAMKQCDVAVFAIDYSKYLTTSEEEYLRKVKEMFTSQNKFHSLIFALNKIDVRYTDVDSPKSFVMSVDFLKTRLANIDEAYRDCIIFPTCSLEYFSAIEAEKAGVTELLPENHMEIGEMKRVKFKHKEVSSLAWLHTHSENLEYYHGLDEISYDVFKKDSGMPALMSYVSYVAQSKARDEIVNHIAFEIDSQKAKIQTILNYIDNIEHLINLSDNKIQEISGILEEYDDEVKNILKENFTEEDIKVLDSDALLRQLGNDLRKIKDSLKDGLKADCEDVPDLIYHMSVNKMWDKIKDGRSIDGTEMDQLITGADFKDIITRIFKDKEKNLSEVSKTQLDKIQREVEAIVKNRQERLKEASDACRDKLSKEKVKLALPEWPEFAFALPMSSYEDNEIDFKNINLKVYEQLKHVLKKTRSWENVRVAILGLFKKTTEKNYVHKFNGNKIEFEEACKNLSLHLIFKGVVSDNDIVDQLEKSLEKVVIEGYTDDMLNTIMSIYADMNKMCNDSREKFQGIIDDREIYHEKSVQLSKRKLNIENINQCIKDFLHIWDGIIGECSEQTEVS